WLALEPAERGAALRCAASVHHPGRRPMIDADPGHDGGPAATGARWLGPAILRIAGWPIESLDGLRSRQLTKRIDDWIDSEEEIRYASDQLDADLYNLVPRVGDRTVRRLALELKRHLNGSLEPLPERLMERLLQDETVHLAVGPAILAAAEHLHWYAAERADIERAHA